jgi:hypothetical protein
MGASESETLEVELGRVETNAIRLVQYNYIWCRLVQPWHRQRQFKWKPMLSVTMQLKP